MMKIVTKRDVIRSMLPRWRLQYSQYRDHEVVGHGDGRRSVKEIARDLERLDKDTCSAADINAIIGNDSWTENKCDECGLDSDVVVHIGDEPDYDARWLLLCPSCLTAAFALLPDRPSTDRAETGKSHD